MNQRSYWKFLRARSFEIGVQEQKSLKFDIMRELRDRENKIGVQEQKSLKFDIMRELRDRENKTAVDYMNQIIDNKVWVYRL